jgi:DNA-binding winged helix-turn-helix (wHTH) protein/tetratricopeptide (TPR) repeat protein
MQLVFGEFELDAPRFELRRGGQVVPLQPKVFDVLKYLILHRDRVVDKTELLEELWPDEIVNESAIAWCVSHARKALGQGKQDKQPIETVHGRGYRFRAETRASVAPPAAPARGSSERPSAAAEARDPLIGRDAVMERLLRAFPVGGKKGGMALLVGDAGVGKTRCALELADRAQASGWTVRVARCLEDDVAPPLWPWIELLREAQESGAASPGILEECSALLQDLLPRGAAPSPQESRRSDEFWLLDRVVRHLLRCAAESPLLIVLDDLQWADLPSLRILGMLAPQLSRAPLFIVGTLRDLGIRQSEQVVSALSGISRHAERITLSELALSDVEAYVQAISGRPARPELAREIHRTSGGNPLLLKETIRLLEDRRGPEWDRVAAASDVAMPEEGREVLRGRLRGLLGEERAVLRVASVLGSTFSLAVLERALDLPEERLLAALDGAVSRRLLAERPGVGEYAFSHELVRDVIYHDLSADERSSLHERVASALEAHALGTSEFEQVAFHYYRALPHGDRAKVVQYASAAGRASMRLFAHEEAARFFGWALEAQAFVEGADPAATAELCISMARACGPLGRRDEARRHLARAIDIAREHRLGALLVRAGKRLRLSFAWGRSPDPLARQALEEALKVLPPSDRAERALALAELAAIPPYSLSLERSRALSDEAVALAEGVGGRCLLEALRSRLFSRTGIGDADDMLATTEEMLRVDALEGPTWASADARYARIGVYFLLGDVPAAERELGAFLRLSRELHLLEAEWHHDRIASLFAYARCEFARAESMWIELASRSEQLGLRYGELLLPASLSVLAHERSGVAPFLGNATAFDKLWDWVKTEPRHRSYMARLLLDVGRRDDARRELEAMCGPDFAAITKDLNYLNVLANCTVIAVALGDMDRVRALYGLLQPYERANTPNGFWFTMGCVAHYLGLLADALGDRQAAVRHLEVGLERNRAMGARMYELHGEIELGRLLAAEAGTKARAAELLRHAEENARALEIVPLIRRIEALRGLS